MKAYRGSGGETESEVASVPKQRVMKAYRGSGGETVKLHLYQSSAS
jgi:hypothetical protein